MVQVLQGVGDDLPPRLFPIDSTTRAALAREAATVVVGTWSEFYGWQLHRVASARLQAVVTRVLAEEPGWIGDSGERARFDLLAPLHADPEPVIHDLGLGEIARVPYALLRQLTPRLGRREVAARLADLRWAEWAAVHILVLELSDDLADRVRPLEDVS